MQVHTGKFYILEGAKPDGSILLLAVSFDQSAMLDFFFNMPAEDKNDFFAFRMSVGGDVIQPPDVPKPTHASPTTPT